MTLCDGNCNDFIIAANLNVVVQLYQNVGLVWKTINKVRHFFSESNIMVMRNSHIAVGMINESKQHEQPHSTQREDPALESAAVAT